MKKLIALVAVVLTGCASAPADRAAYDAVHQREAQRASIIQDYKSLGASLNSF